MTTENNILRSIHHLRTNGDFILHSKEPIISKKQLVELEDFLQIEFENECLDFPYAAVDFHPKAAIWAAKTLYYAVQFVAHRKMDMKELQKFFPIFDAQEDISAWLSADLSLRFLPVIVDELQAMDFEDELPKHLNKILQTFHYSAIGHEIETKEIDVKNLFQNPTFKILYIDRVIEKKALNFCKIPEVEVAVKTQLGEYHNHFWKEL